jgi:hypothetical protein
MNNTYDPQLPAGEKKRQTICGPHSQDKASSAGKKAIALINSLFIRIHYPGRMDLPEIAQAIVSFGKATDAGYIIGKLTGHYIRSKSGGKRKIE